jgi:glycosyltransferase involved in cell wall biosynthesis
VAEHRVAYVVNNVAFFVSHRLTLSLAAREAGLNVRLFTGEAGSQEMERIAVARLLENGLAYERAVFTSSGVNPLRELLGLVQLITFIIWYKPDIMHCASPKGVVYGGLAARICRVRSLVLAISGMGYAYTGGERKGLRSLARWSYCALSTLALRHPNLKVIVQNNDDYRAVIDKELIKASSVSLIPGSGVNLSLFEGCTAMNKSKIVLLPARMLRDKGVEEFVKAAYLVKAQAPDWRFVLAGAAGYDNPSAIAPARLRSWQDEGYVEWLGHIDNMIPLYRESSIVCLPSYREGMPKALLEAAAAACAVVTTDVTGCREAVEPGVTGDLVPVSNSEALAQALLSLIKDAERRQRYGANGQRRARAHFSDAAVVSQTLDIYKELLSND